jgi:hypothetical protein
MVVECGGTHRPARHDPLNGPVTLRAVDPHCARHQSYSPLLGCYTKSSRSCGKAASCDYLIFAECLGDLENLKGRRFAEVTRNLHII